MRQLIVMPMFKGYKRFIYWNSANDNYEYPPKFKVSSIKYVELEATFNKKPVLIDLGKDIKEDYELVEVIKNFKATVESAGGSVRIESTGNKTTRFYLI